MTCLLKSSSTSGVPLSVLLCRLSGCVQLSGRADFDRDSLSRRRDPGPKRRDGGALTHGAGLLLAPDRLTCWYSWDRYEPLSHCEEGVDADARKRAWARLLVKV